MNKLLKIGLLQATGVVAYISLVALVMNNAERIFGQMDTIIAPITFLTMFSASALICGLIVFGMPFKLFWIEKKQVEAMKLVGYTAGFLVLGLVLLFVSMMVF